ncbi:tyrosine-type recombinase/integrase [Deinococcus aestuarii]|uniref:tyrosine-type recombinase/integrase n=1 Tax=Deinococcus aestuarii TaxID=2774531 RepID=UPI001C0E2476
MKAAPTRRKPATPAKQQRGKIGLPSIVERADGRWALTVELAPHPDGRRHRLQRTCATREEALEAARAINYQAAQRLPRQARDLTVRQLLAHWSARQPVGEHSTSVNRAWLITIIESKLGDRPVMKITATEVQNLLADLAREQRAPSTVAKCHRLLRTALRDAVAQGVLAANPADTLRTPAVPSRIQDEAWTQEEVARIVRAARGSRIHALVIVALSTGARLGELVGARLEDYDPQTGTLSIEGTAKRGGGRGKGKTAAAHRQCPLPVSAQRVMRVHLGQVAQARADAGPLWGQRQETTEETRRKQQEASRRRAARPLPAGWIPASPPAAPYEPLFPTANGTPWQPGNVRKHWAQVLEAAGLPFRRFHSIRSAFITAALQDGNLSLSDIQATVGHRSPQMTLRYAQRVRGRQQQVAAAAARGLGLDAALEET